MIDGWLTPLLPRFVYIWINCWSDDLWLDGQSRVVYCSLWCKYQVASVLLSAVSANVFLVRYTFRDRSASSRTWWVDTCSHEGQRQHDRLSAKVAYVAYVWYCGSIFQLTAAISAGGVISKRESARRHPSSQSQIFATIQPANAFCWWQVRDSPRIDEEACTFVAWIYSLFF